MQKGDRSTKQLSDIFHVYSPENIVRAVRSTQTFASEVYDITDAQGQRYFLKILKSQLPAVIALEARMQQKLLAADLGTPQYLQITPGEYVGEYNGTRFLLSKYIPGQPPKNVTPALIESFGATLAKIHHALQGIKVPANDMQWLNRERVLDDLGGYYGPAKQDLVQLMQRGGLIFERDLPQTTIHADLWMSNVFARGDTITTVFDLETAEHTVRLVDLARTFTSMKFNSSYPASEITGRLVTGYNSAATVPLTNSELDSFNLAITFVAGACGTWHAVHGTRYMEPYIAFGKEALGLRG